MPMLGNDANDAGALKMTVQKFYRVAGGSTQLRGIVSDIRLPSVTDNNEFGKRLCSIRWNTVRLNRRIEVAANRKALLSTSRAAFPESCQPGPPVSRYSRERPAAGRAAEDIDCH